MARTGDDDVQRPGGEILEALGISEALPAMRLPAETELATAARESGLLIRAHELAQWTGDWRSINDDGELSADDSVAAAIELGIALPPTHGGSAEVGPGGQPQHPVSTMLELPELVQAWELADSVALIEACDGHVHVDADTFDWTDDDDILALWTAGLAYVVSESLQVDADVSGRSDLDLNEVGVLPMVLLFLAGGQGCTHAELRELMIELATSDEHATSSARRAWASWTKAHGDPVDVLVERLVEHGAARADGETVRLTPLGSWSVREQLVDLGADVPLLPPVEEMTAADLVMAATGMDEDELAAETSAWLKLRAPEAAVAELLAVAASGGAAERMFATSIAKEAGPAGEQHWRDVLDQPALAPYAKIALNGFAGVDVDDPAQASPGLRPEPTDLAWLLTDMLVATVNAGDSDDIGQTVRDALPRGSELMIFEEMARLPHPDAPEMLTLLGRSHPDKKTAKAARRAAVKAASRRQASS